MSIKFRMHNYLESLLKVKSQIEVCQDFIVKENSVEKTRLKTGVTTKCVKKTVPQTGKGEL